ncbi:MAG: YraN family protein [Lachnospiraceae bacterium]|nr:YraN family protein [Lachnospiraceae bacterium]
MNRRSVGEEKENLAIRYLSDLGCRILFHGFHTRQGEIDIIALEGDTLCFTEVKYRKDQSAGLPEEAVSFAKQRKICRCADSFLYLHPEYTGYNIRFDVVGILGDTIRITRNAFPYCGRAI